MSAPSSSSKLGTRLLVVGLLLAGTLLVFAQTAGHPFIDMDDRDYIFNNPQVYHGLTLRGVLWACLRTGAENWHPLTWISHMADCQFFGLNAGRHHATNVALHALSACLLLLLLERMTGALWPSAVAAAVFAIHPLHVESVAWAAERKDVLSGLFFFLTLWAYESYVRHGRSTGRYLLVTVLFAAGLTCKPMLVTLPLVMLLMDYWPLGRFCVEEGPAAKGPDERTSEPADPEAQTTQQQATVRGRAADFLPLLVEKIPWLVLSATLCLITLVAQKKAISPLDRLPIRFRLPNAVLSYATYLKQAVWPQDLAIYYPYPARFRAWPVAVAVVLLAGATVAAVCLRRKRPYLLVGWLWYLVMLVPVIGLVQAGDQALADRYAYLPLVGISLCVAWGANRLRPALAAVPRGRGGPGGTGPGSACDGGMAADRLLADQRWSLAPCRRVYRREPHGPQQSRRGADATPAARRGI